MNKHAIWHTAKSEVSYAYDQNTLHMILKTEKNDIDQVQMVHGDPFEWDGDSQGKAFWVHKVEPMHKRYQNSLFDFFFIEIKPTYFRTKYIFILKTKEKQYAFGAKRLFEISSEDDLYGQFDLSDFFNYPYLNQEDLHHTPSWVKDTIWYQIFPDRFYGYMHQSKLPWGKLPVNNYEIYGGNLKGVIKKIPYLKSLGINGIYFTPIFLAPTAHKYDTTDYFLIDPQFGTNQDFKDLVDCAHAHGIKVMLDGVFNHAGYEHPFFQDVIKHGKDSPYKNCFFINDYPLVNFDLDQEKKPKNFFRKKLNYLTFAFTPFMPKWNTADPIVEKHLLDSIAYWIKSYDIDGWRLDVSNEISHDFLKKIKIVSREAKKDTFILGENWDASYPWLHGDQLDSVMNYELAFPLWKYLEHKIDLNTFKDMIINYLALTPKHVMENMFNLVGSHDTVRIKRRLADDNRRVKLAYVFMFLSAGAPNIYYGDEVGLTGEHDPDNRRCMPWDDQAIDHDFLSFFKKLINLRQTIAAFKTYDYHFLSDDVLAFIKKDDNDEILCLLNNGPAVIYNIPNDLCNDYVDLFTDENVSLYDKISLETYDFKLLRKK